MDPTQIAFVALAVSTGSFFVSLGLFAVAYRNLRTSDPVVELFAFVLNKTLFIEFGNRGRSSLQIREVKVNLDLWQSQEYIRPTQASFKVRFTPGVLPVTLAGHSYYKAHASASDLYRVIGSRDFGYAYVDVYAGGRRKPSYRTTLYGTNLKSPSRIVEAAGNILMSPPM